MTSIDKTAWIDQGFKILKAAGAAGLTIENLTGHLKKTKGSFYHHFKNRDDYSRQLLSAWEKKQTLDIIQVSQQEHDFDRINETLMALSENTMDPEVEVAVRAWALRDPLAREFQARIDALRVSFLNEMFSLLTRDARKAALFSLIRYCFYIGSHQIIPAMDDTTYKHTLTALMTLFINDAQKKTAKKE